MRTTIGILLTVVCLLLATRPIVTLSQGALESYWFARMNGLSMDLTKRLGLYLIAALAVLAILVAASWALAIAVTPGR